MYGSAVHSSRTRAPGRTHPREDIDMDNRSNGPLTWRGVVVVLGVFATINHLIFVIWGR